MAFDKVTQPGLPTLISQNEQAMLLNHKLLVKVIPLGDKHLAC